MRDGKKIYVVHKLSKSYINDKTSKITIYYNFTFLYYIYKLIHTHVHMCIQTHTHTHILPHITLKGKRVCDKFL